jgi:hypothetical protein
MTSSQEAREYQPLPEADAWPLGPAVPFFGPEKMRSYVDADRKARQQEAQRFEWLLNNYSSLMCTHQGMAPKVTFQPCLLNKDFTPDMLRASIDAAIAKGERHE